MDSTSFVKRVVGGIIDIVLLFFLLNLFSAVFYEIFHTGNDYTASTYIVIWIILPVQIIANMVTTPGYFGGDSVYYVLFVLLFLIETSYYFIMALLPTKGTLGHFWMKMRIYKTDGSLPNAATLLIRSILKTISRYLFGLPLLLIFFTRKDQALHDLLTKTVVLEK